MTDRKRQANADAIEAAAAAPQEIGSLLRQASSPLVTASSTDKEVSLSEPTMAQTTIQGKISKPARTGTKVLATPASSTKKRKRTSSQQPTNDYEELPHNLGKVPARPLRPINPEDDAQEGVTAKKQKLNNNEEEVNILSTQTQPHLANDGAPLPASAPSATPPPTTTQGKKPRRRPAVPYGHRWNETPFPTFPHPTPQECHTVNTLLTSLHGKKEAPEIIPPPSETFAGCGEAPSILDGLVRTILSANTMGNYSGKAIEAMIKRFGKIETGPAAGSVDYDLVRRTGVEDLIAVIMPGGTQKLKAGWIKRVLDAVYVENCARRALNDRKEGADDDDPVQRASLFSCADPATLSLDHMRAMTYHEAFAALIKFPGVALKTASCVCLYALRHASFAVDTHVHRITEWLGWHPEGCDENKSFGHLEYLVPDELKYSLHTLFVLHGKECVRCAAKSHEGTKGWWDKACPLEGLVKRVKKMGKKERLIKGQSRIAWGKVGKKVQAEVVEERNGSCGEDGE